MITVKLGVKLDINNLRPEMIRVKQAAMKTCPSGEDVTITSAAEQYPRANFSLHPFGFAEDYRANHLTREYGHRWAAEMQELLGSEYDVIAHGKGDQFHIHAEWDGGKKELKL